MKHIPAEEFVGVGAFQFETTIYREVIESPDDLSSLAPHFRSLTQRALSQNGFFLLPVIESAWRHIFKWYERAELVLYWRRTPGAHDDQLVGVFPLAYGPTRWAGLPITDAFCNPMCFQGTPYLDNRYAEEVLTYFLKDEKARRLIPHSMRFRWVPSSGRFCEIFKRAAARAGWSVRLDANHKRAFMDATKSAEENLKNALSSNKRRKLGRFLRRLNEKADVKFEVVENDGQIAAALDEFLDLEASGWKGRGGTAILSNDTWATYFKELVHGLAPDENIKIYRLYCGQDLLSSALLVHSGTEAWCWKIAFNEDFASYSPGLLLTKYMTEYLCDETDVTSVDSCSIQGNNLTETIWDGRLEISDIFAVPTLSPARHLVFAAEDARRTTRESLKHIKNMVQHLAGRLRKLTEAFSAKQRTEEPGGNSSGDYVKV